MIAEYAIQVTLSVIAVVGLILLAGFLLRHGPMGAGLSRGPIQVLGNVPVGIKEKLILVQVGDEQVLIGASSNGLTMLHRLRSPVPVEPQADSSTDFKRKLAELMGNHGERGQ